MCIRDSLQHAAVIFLRHKCRNEPESSIHATPGRTSHPCADLANTASIDLTHEEASALLRQLLHERCQSEAIVLSSADARSPDAASFLVMDTVRRVAEEEQELRDYAGLPVDREEIAKRPRMPEDGPLLLSDGVGKGGGPFRFLLPVFIRFNACVLKLKKLGGDR